MTTCFQISNQSKFKFVRRTTRKLYGSRICQQFIRYLGKMLISTVWNWHENQTIDFLVYLDMGCHIIWHIFCNLWSFLLPFFNCKSNWIHKYIECHSLFYRSKLLASQINGDGHGYFCINIHKWLELLLFHFYHSLLSHRLEIDCSNVICLLSFIQ